MELAPKREVEIHEVSPVHESKEKVGEILESINALADQPQRENSVSIGQKIEVIHLDSEESISGAVHSIAGKATGQSRAASMLATLK